MATPHRPVLYARSPALLARDPQLLPASPERLLMRSPCTLQAVVAQASDLALDVGTLPPGEQKPGACIR